MFKRVGHCPEGNFNQFTQKNHTSCFAVQVPHALWLNQFPSPAEGFENDVDAPLHPYYLNHVLIITLQ